MRLPEPYPIASSLTARFPDVTRGMAAIREMRGAGFAVDVTGSEDGDLGAVVATTPDRRDELESIVEAHDGTIVRGLG